VEGHAFSSRQVGDYQITALCDGTMTVGFELLRVSMRLPPGKYRAATALRRLPRLLSVVISFAGTGALSWWMPEPVAEITPGERYRQPCARPASRLRISTLFF